VRASWGHQDSGHETFGSLPTAKIEPQCGQTGCCSGADLDPCWIGVDEGLVIGSLVELNCNCSRFHDLNEALKRFAVGRRQFRTEDSNERLAIERSLKEIFR
jgi:hypothetical protein